MARKSKVRKSKRSMKGGNAAAVAAAATAEVVPFVQASTLGSSPVTTSVASSTGAPVTTDDATKTALTGGSANGVPNGVQNGATTGANGVQNAVTAGNAVGPVPSTTEAVRTGSALAPSKFGGSKTLKGGKKAGSKRTRGNCDGKAYCVKCKKMNTIKNCVNASASNGRKMIKGTCATCGTKMNKFV